MKNHQGKTPALLLPLAILIAMACVGCGEKADYSGSGDLSKPSVSEAPKPTASGATPSAHEPMMIPNQPRPDGH